jgi:hypothetical protein
MSHNRPVVLVLSAVGLAVAALMVLTGQGQLRRGGAAGTVLLAGFFFPVTWVAWYVGDRRRAQRSGAASDSRTSWR